MNLNDLQNTPVWDWPETARETILRTLVNLTAPLDDDAVRHWLLNAKIGVLNVAGPRESSSPGIAGRAQAALERLLRDETGEPTDIVN